MTLWIAFAVGALAFGQGFGPTPSAPVISAELWPLSPAGDAEDCSKPELLANGYPVMASIRKGLSFGISLGQHAFREGDPIELHIWVDNTSGAPAGVFTCRDLARFMKTGFEILREDGSRVLSRNESKAREKCSTDPKAAASWGVWACARNIQISIPAHTCVTHDNRDFKTELTDRYVLPPGKYAIRLRRAWNRGIDLCREESRGRFRARRSDLIFTVTGP